MNQVNLILLYLELETVISKFKKAIESSFVSLTEITDAANEACRITNEIIHFEGTSEEQKQKLQKNIQVIEHHMKLIKQEVTK